MSLRLELATIIGKGTESEFNSALERAGALPPYIDPYEHVINIGATRVARFTLARSITRRRNITGVRLMVERAEDELTQMEACGVRTLPRSHYIATDQHKQVHVLSVTNRVQGIVLDMTNRRNRQPFKDELQATYQGLTRYLTTKSQATDTRGPVYWRYDDMLPKQYMCGTDLNTNDDPHVYHIDVDPRVARVWRPSGMLTELEGLAHNWSEFIEDTTVAI